MDQQDGTDLGGLFLRNMFKYGHREAENKYLFFGMLNSSRRLCTGCINKHLWRLNENWQQVGFWQKPFSRVSWKASDTLNSRKHNDATCNFHLQQMECKLVPNGRLLNSGKWN